MDENGTIAQVSVACSRTSMRHCVLCANHTGLPFRLAQDGCQAPRSVGISRLANSSPQARSPPSMA